MSEQRTEAVSDLIYKCPACDGYNLKRSKENPAVCHDCHDDGTPKTMTEAVSEEAKLEEILRVRFPYIDQQEVNRPVTVHWFDVIRAIETALSPRVQSGDGEVERKFGDWFDEQEGYALRSERLFEELRVDNLSQAARIRLWLESAYNAGAEHARAAIAAIDGGR